VLSIFYLLAVVNFSNASSILDLINHLAAFDYFHHLAVVYFTNTLSILDLINHLAAFDSIHLLADFVLLKTFFSSSILHQHNNIKYLQVYNPLE